MLVGVSAYYLYYNDAFRNFNSDSRQINLYNTNRKTVDVIFLCHSSIWTYQRPIWFQLVLDLVIIFKLLMSKIEYVTVYEVSVYTQLRNMG
jgi:hypothetical protein